MARIEITDLEKDITISEDEIKHVKGGAAYIKFDGVDGESRRLFPKVEIGLDRTIRDTQFYKI